MTQICHVFSSENALKLIHAQNLWGIQNTFNKLNHALEQKTLVLLALDGKE